MKTLESNRLVLGTQTFGLGTSENDSYRILDIAFECGIHSIDTAERYPYPESINTIGITEKIIGNWIKSRPIVRTKIEICTKVSGRSNNDWFEESGRLTKKRIQNAIDSSLKRLKIDQIDLYYLHWPDRYTNSFGRKYYDPEIDPVYIPLEEQIEVLSNSIRAGKIKKIGISNETAWGFMKFIEISSMMGCKIHSIQNEYSILNRNFEIANSEISLRENVLLRAYSPLAVGLLTGKYGNNKVDPNSRLILHAQSSQRYIKGSNFDKANSYIDFCLQRKIDPIQTAISYVLSKKFVNKAIVGVRSVDQMKHYVKILDNPDIHVNFQALESAINFDDS